MLAALSATEPAAVVKAVWVPLVPRAVVVTGTVPRRPDIVGACSAMRIADQRARRFGGRLLMVSVCEGTIGVVTTTERVKALFKGSETSRKRSISPVFSLVV